MSHSPQLLNLSKVNERFQQQGDDWGEVHKR